MDLNVLRNLEQHELCALLEQGSIGWVQWVMAQPEDYPGYEEWMEEKGLSMDEESARTFVSFMEEETVDGTMRTAAAAAAARRVMQDAADNGLSR